MGASTIALITAVPAFAQPGPSDQSAPTRAEQPATPAAVDPVSTDEAVAADDAIVVTGSRVVTDGSKAPTPITVVATETLQATTPTNIPEGLNKLPIFQGSQQVRSPGNGAQNQASNVLALRGFGAQRTLVLMDGHRVTPSNANGTVSIDVLPQMVFSRVDVVTGGASAVYGSDAVTGVVNFVIDKNFTGVKLDANTGISTYGDGFGYKAGIAAGAKLFGGRGHVLASLQHYSREAVDNFERPFGPRVFVLTGAGTEANPFVVSENVRRADSAFGGKIQSCVNPCSARGMQFVQDGIIGPFNPGLTTGTNNQNVGGDGAYSRYSTALSSLRTTQAFLRFDYDVSDDIAFYAQGSFAKQHTFGRHFPAKLTPVNGTPTVSNSTASVFFKNNPLLSPAAQAQLGNNGQTNNSNVFSVGTYFINLGPDSQVGAISKNRFVNFNTGLTGSLGKFRWDVYYTHGNNLQTVTNVNNSNYQKQFAALDAVVAPDGTIKCYAATQPATAATYAGCVPLNGFGPTATTWDMFRWFTGDTTYDMTNVMDDVGASIVGDIFNTWAGPVRMSVSGEVRWNKLKVESSDDPLTKVNCTGLRICNPDLALWAQPILANVDVGNRVWEIAGELQVPLLTDAPIAKSLTANLAGRHTVYSTSGSVKTWKVGLVWELNNWVRLRGTTSVDIRAPTLIDLFGPERAQVTGFVDIHTQRSDTLFFTSRGNPDLVPEKARTWIFGAVLQPPFIPGLTASVDYYKIKLDNAIAEIAATNNVVQRLCEDSGGTSPFCSLFERPLPFSDRSAANFPTRIFTQNLNVAFHEVKGFDFELGYSTGPFNARIFANYQPTNRQQLLPGTPITNIVGPKTRITALLNYSTERLSVSVQNSWWSDYDLAPIRTADPKTTTQYRDDRLGSYNRVDVNLEYKIQHREADMSLYFNVQNLFNTKGEVTPPSGSIGLSYPVPGHVDIMGRYFTVGFKARL